MNSKNCPVTFKKTGKLSSEKTSPVVYGESIYFVRENLVQEFITCAFTYANQPPPKPLVLPGICILGCPKSGKTSIATKVASEMGLVYLNPNDIIENILLGPEIHDLRQKVVMD